MPPCRMGNVHVALPWGREGSLQEGSPGRHSMPVHFHDGAERWENEVVLIAAALFSSTPKIHQGGEARIPGLHQGKKTKSWQFHSCPGDAPLGASGEDPCEGREPLRADKTASSQNQH